MAKVQAPLFSTTASGTIGQRLVFSSRSSGQQVRFQKKNRYTRTFYQNMQRTRFLLAVHGWRILSPVGKRAVNYQARNLPMTGYNLYLKRRLS
jgi:hypothetical protein